MSVFNVAKYDARVEVFSHNVTFTRVKPDLRRALVDFSRGLMSFSKSYKPNRGFVDIPNKVYAASNPGRTFFRFHRHQLEELMAYLERRGYKESRFEMVNEPPFRPVEVEFNSISGKEPRDYQIDTIEFFKSPGSCKVTTLQTGKGKSFILLNAIKQIGVRTLIAIPGKYVYKWKGDVLEEFDMKSRDLMVIRGAKALISAINLGLSGELTAKIIIITSTTLYNFYKAFEHNKGGDYPCHPNDLMRVLGVGLKAIDEVHENLHLNFKQDLYTHVDKTIVLSATLENDDRFIESMMELAYPHRCRFNALEYDKYIAVTAIEYTVDDLDRFKYMGKNKMYSHNVFEQSILADKDRSEAYFGMIQKLVDDQFAAKWLDGLKYLVFCSSIEMCTALAEYIRPFYSNWTVRRYTGDDPDEYLYESDLVITTLKSAGTAVDIPNLDSALLTVAVGSKQLNEQAKGRLRKIKLYPDRTPRYFYLVACNIPKHVEYHQRKVTSFTGRVLSHKTLSSKFRI
jgi:superfamily II DNA or RNA helicase